MAETTTRAYTLKLKGDRLALWRNHVIFNRGVRAWGEWLLNLRGELPASLADHKDLLTVEKSAVAQAVKERAAAITPAAIRQEPKFDATTDKKVRQEVAARKKKITEVAVAKELLASRRSELRRILALSWLCPETPVQLTPQAFIVAAADDSDRERKVLDRFRQILKHKGVADVTGWAQDCDATLRAAIRSDAVWVDRTACFSAMPSAVRPSEIDAARHLFRLFGSASDYFAIPSSTSGPAEPKDFGPVCRDWVSSFWGGGDKANKAQIVAALTAISQMNPSRVVGKRGPVSLSAIASVLKQKPADDSAEAVARAIGWKAGKFSAARMAINAIATSPRVTRKQWDRLVLACEKDCSRQNSNLAFAGSATAVASALEPYIAGRTGMPYAATREKLGEYGAMLAFAVRRVSQIHTKAKQAETERQSFAPEQARIKLVPSAARQWLDNYVERRTAASGAIDGYQLRKRALGGWAEVVAIWAGCKTREDRIASVRDLQADLEKPGDMQLYEALAADDAMCAWRLADGSGDPSLLADHVRAAVACQNAVRFKVPAYRHPDPLRSPSFIGFGRSQWSISYSAQVEIRRRKKHLERGTKSVKDAERARNALAVDPVLQQVSLDLWDLGEMRSVEYRWQSTRLLNELALGSVRDLAGEKVCRATRFGTAGAAGGPFLLEGIDDEAPWNGRLQAPRRELEDLARSLDAQNLPYDEETKWPAKLQARLRRIGWFLSRSAKLTPSGPWLDYVAKGLPAGYEWSENQRLPYERRLFYEDNKGRERFAKLLLSRLPGLRVLSVDLGLRTSAAAAVWQVVSKRELNAARDGADSVTEEDLYCLVRSSGRTQVFRRIGPSAWARLDRQFLIRLDGEQSAARPATNDEWSELQNLRSWLGCLLEDKPERLPPVDRLQQQAGRLCRLGLRRLSDLARVAFLLTAQTRDITGGRPVPLDYEGQVEAAQDALTIWHALASSEEFQDSRLRRIWQAHVSDGPALAARLTKKQRQEVRDALRPAAERLRGDVAVSGELTSLWQERSAEWGRRLRWLRDWVIPRFSKRTKGERVRLARKVGGLSLDRIATIRGVYQVMRAYASRPEPTNLRAGAERLEKAATQKLRPEFGRRMLTKMERLRENRIKQIASRIVEAALGVGSEDRLHWDNGRKRPTAAIAGPRFAPCHAVVIEHLENYRPDDKRTRRENRGLMTWAARAVHKYLAEGCELHGLYLRQVNPSYTSRQDSRTGSPGLRCNDISAKELANPHGWLGQLITRATEAVKEGAATPRQKLLFTLAEAARTGEITSPAVRIIVPGGQLFVAADSSSPASQGIHADMNAAANIGLVALLDPDWSAAWWRLPCKTATGEVDETKVGGSAAVPVGKPILHLSEQGGKVYVNAWSDPQEKAVIRREWADTKTYWRAVEGRVVEILLAWNRVGGRARQRKLPF
jgi:IS605 OrfB family transposase